MAEVRVEKDLENKSIIIEYVANGSIDKAWRAYADKEWFERWWGPEGWETIAKEFNFTEGGRIHYDMHCVDERQGEWFDQHSWSIMFINSIDEPNEFTYTDHFSDEAGEINKDMPSTKTIVKFNESDGKTTVTTTTITDTVEQLEELIKMGMIEGYKSQIDKIEALFV